MSRLHCLNISMLLGVLLLPASANAASLDTTVISDAVVLQAPQLMSPANRRQLALELQSHFRKLDSSYADNTPEEMTWLQKNYLDELKRNGNSITNKALQAQGTTIYTVYVTKGYISDYLSVLDHLVNGVENNQKLEVIYWTKLAALLSDNAAYAGNIYQLAEKNDAIKKEVKKFAYSDTRWELYAGNLSLRANQIIEQICLPSMISMSKYMQGTQ